MEVKYMKIEKLTDNKIRIILNLDDLAQNNVDINSIISNSAESQNLLMKLLNQAENEIGFYTKNSKILIEALASPEGEFVFTITKLSSSISNTTQNYKKQLIIKRKKYLEKNSHLIYAFENFDVFYDFCNYISKTNLINNKIYFKDSSLYLYNNIYFLLFPNIDKNLSFFNRLNSAASEFASIKNYSSIFENKLLEHGKCIFKKNAIKNCIRHFNY